jgi:hypothetical protein
MWGLPVTGSYADVSEDGDDAGKCGKRGAKRAVGAGVGSGAGSGSGAGGKGRKKKAAATRKRKR